MFMIIECSQNPYWEVVIRNGKIQCRSSPDEMYSDMPIEAICDLLEVKTKALDAYIQRFAVLYMIRNKIEDAHRTGLLDDSTPTVDYKDRFDRLSGLIKVFQQWLNK